MASHDFLEQVKWMIIVGAIISAAMVIVSASELLHYLVVTYG